MIAGAAGAVVGAGVNGVATTAGGAASLLGFPLVEAEDMPDVAADSFSVVPVGMLSMT